MAFRRSIYKTPDELRAMVAPGVITAAALDAVIAAIRPGITTAELDGIAESVIRAAGARPNFALVPGYSHTICASVNEVVVHGIPDSRALVAGDIVSIDCGAEFEGWNGDSARTVVLADAADPAGTSARLLLSEVTERALWAGIAALADVRHLNEVGAAIEDAVTAAGDYGILEDYTGHGIGRSMHEDPPVFNYRVRGNGPAVRPGLVVAIEPMVTAGGIETYTADDGWSVITTDGSMASHWEHSVAVHDGGIWVLTAHDGGAAGLAAHGVVPVPVG